MANTYKGILTNNGKALIANASLNNKINYSHIAIGDGNGSVPVPSETRPNLVNEKARFALNVVEINPNNTNQIVCEAIIPSTVGGFFIRELGLYAGSTMVVNASYPPTYKPFEEEGAAREIAIKLIINIQNAEVIALYLDDSLIYATRDWVNNNYIRRNEIIDNLTTDDPNKPLSAKQGKVLQDNKLDKTANAVSASKLQVARTISYSGAATGSFSFDGSANATCVLTLANSGVTAGTYASTIQIPQITVNNKGLITSVSQQNIRSATTAQSGVVQLADDLSTDDASKALTAKQGKVLQDTKFDKSGGFVEGDLKILGIGEWNGFRTGNGDNATLEVCNIDFYTWHGFGIKDYQGVRRIAFDARSGIITASKFTGDLTGNAASATKLQTANCKNYMRFFI